MFPTRRPPNGRPCATTPLPTSQEPMRCGRLAQDVPVKQELVKRVHDYASFRKRRAPVSYQVLTCVYIEANDPQRPQSPEEDLEGGSSSSELTFTALAEPLSSQDNSPARESYAAPNGLRNTPSVARSPATT
ncbi:uncharacterized protein LOC142776871 [Rhipicephalus microplus]|uniref:uncharacterized protein LOC142776871 n=1 Tax=Rhipicephalus microplus TaxID=6941 RepID=UPI003F6D5F66